MEWSTDCITAQHTHTYGGTYVAIHHHPCGMRPSVGRTKHSRELICLPTGVACPLPEGQGGLHATRTAWECRPGVNPYRLPLPAQPTGTPTQPSTSFAEGTQHNRVCAGPTNATAGTHEPFGVQIGTGTSTHARHVTERTRSWPTCHISQEGMPSNCETG